MPTIADLLLPILLSGVAVFVVSSVVHMLLPLHRKDYGQLPSEAAILDALRAGKVEPGPYRFPWCGSMKELGEPAMQEKFERGPVGLLTLLPPGPMKLGRSLGLWFLYSLLVGLLVAYVGTMCLPRGADAMVVFRVTGTVALAGYAIGVINDTIWKGQRWCVTSKFVFDGLLYALATAGVFAALWPAVG